MITRIALTNENDERLELHIEGDSIEAHLHAMVATFLAGKKSRASFEAMLEAYEKKLDHDALYRAYHRFRTLEMYEVSDALRAEIGRLSLEISDFFWIKETVNWK